jgi:hypothetical protein
MPRSDWQAMEERIDAQRWTPSLAVAAEHLLPEGMALLTATPQQAVLNGLVRRVFILGFICRDKRVVAHVEEHCDDVAPDTQLRWAIERFETHLKAAELV